MRSDIIPLSGLTPGATYYAEMQHSVDAGNTADITRKLRVQAAS